MVYSLTAFEFIILVVTDAVICGAGFLAFRQWTRRDSMPPAWFIVLMLAGAFVAYGLVARELWLKADTSHAFADAGTINPEERTAERHPYVLAAQLMASRSEAMTHTAGAQPNRVPVLILYCLAFWTVPVVYYTHLLRTSISSRWVDRRAPDYAATDDERALKEDLEFENARDFALAGDTVGALGGGRTYSRKRVYGCFVGARILEAEGRYEEAAGVLKEIADLSAANESVWAEATFRMGLIYDKCLERAGDASMCYQMVAGRCPRSPYGEMASIALHRLCPEGDALLDALDAGFSGPGSGGLRNEPAGAV